MTAPRPRGSAQGTGAPRSISWALLVAPGLVALLACARPAHAQSSEPLEAFLGRVETAAALFETPEAAMAAGYRKLGPDFPGMGEHWIHPGRVIAGRLDPSRPPVLAYTVIGDRRVLVGFAFTRVLGPDEPPPDGPFPAAAWHDHSEGIDEESLLLSGPASMHPPERSGHRLAMVHVWLPLPNPQGVLAQNNWHLPFLRAGIEGPDDVSSQAARALSLAGTGEGFYASLLRDGLDLDGDELRRADAAFGHAGEQARAWLSAQSSAPPSREALSQLEAIWTRLWRDLERVLDPQTFARLGPLNR